MAIPTSNVKWSTIQSEFGGSAPTSMSEYYSTGTNVGVGQTGASGAIPSSGAISASKFKSANSSWMLSVNQPSSTTNISDMSCLLDDSDNTYVAGFTYVYDFPTSTTIYKGMIRKHNASGDTVWQKTISPPGTYDTLRFYRMVFDTSGNLIVTGWRQSNTTYQNYLIVIKFSTDGSIIWQKEYTNAAYTTNIAQGIVCDSSGNIYVSAIRNRTGADTYSYYTPFLFKLDSSGTLQWVTGLYNENLDTGATSFSGNPIAVDSSGNIFMVTSCSDTVDFRGKVSVVKYNSSGTLQWQRKLSSTSYWLTASSISVDSSGNVYASLKNDGAQVTTFVKYNTSGTLQFQKLTDLSENFGMMFDDSGNIYTLHTNGPSALMVKFNSSVSPVWHKYASQLNGGNFNNLNPVSMYYNKTTDIVVSTGGLAINFGTSVVTKLRGGLLSYYPLTTINNFRLTPLASVTVSNGTYVDGSGTMLTTTPTLSTSTPSYSTSDASFAFTKGKFGE